MIDIDIRAEFKQAERALRGAEKELNTATSRAINDTLKQARTHASRTLQEDLNLKNQRAIKKGLVMRRAGKYRLQGMLLGGGSPVPASHFKGSRATKRQGVKFNYWGNHRHIQRGFKYNGTFFMRRGKKRHPITKIFGPSIPTAMARRAIKSSLVKLANKKLPERFRYHIGAALAKHRLR